MKTELPEEFLGFWRAAELAPDRPALTTSSGVRMTYRELLAEVNRTLVTAIFGTVRNMFERNLPNASAEALRRQLILMCRAYLDAARCGSRAGLDEQPFDEMDRDASARTPDAPRSLERQDARRHPPLQKG